MKFNIGFRKGKHFSLNAQDLTRHVFVVGGTGSGKTVLCKNLIEQAVINKVPIIAFDPKGDISGLGIASKDFDFRPFLSDKEAAKTKGVYLQKVKDKELDAADAETYAKNLRIEVYAPGNPQAKKLALGPTIAPPAKFKEIYEKDKGVLSYLVQPLASSLLELIGHDDDKEEAFLSNLILHCWLNNVTVDPEVLIDLVRNVPFQKIGALQLDEFISINTRNKLAADLNLLLSSPKIAKLLEGDKLDFSEKLQPGHVTVIDLRWAGEKEKHYIVAKVLSELYAYLLSKGGSQSLRYLLYFDELYGFLPPAPSNPASKKMLETLVRQGRAFGLGMILSTQNPGDIDYKVFGNIGTRFIGKLKTQNDLEKVATATNLFASELAEKVNVLKQGEFLHNPLDSDKVENISAKWLYSLHKGPLTEEEIALVNANVWRQTTPLEAVMPRAVDIEKTKMSQLLPQDAMFEELPIIENADGSEVDYNANRLKAMVDSAKSQCRNVEVVYCPPITSSDDALGNYKRKIDTRVALQKEKVKRVLEPHVRVEIELEKNKGLLHVKEKSGPLVDNLVRSYVDSRLKEAQTNLRLPSNCVLEHSKKPPSRVIYAFKKQFKNKTRGVYYVSLLTKQQSRSLNQVLEWNENELTSKKNEEIRFIEKKYKNKISDLESKQKRIERELEGAKSKLKREDGYQAKILRKRIRRLDVERNATKREIELNTRRAKREYEYTNKVFDRKVRAAIRRVRFTPNISDLDVKVKIMLVPREVTPVKINGTRSAAAHELKNDWGGVEEIARCVSCNKSVTSGFACGKCGGVSCDEHHDKCRLCGDYTCFKCLSTCVGCKDKNCLDCMKECAYCKRLTCTKCQRKCTKCSRAICTACEKHERKWLLLKKSVCEKCAEKIN